MESEKLSVRNFRSMLILMILCGSMVNGAFNVAQDTWVSVLLMEVLFLPVMIVYSRLCSLYPGKNLFDIIEVIYGRWVGAVITFLVTAFLMLVTALQLRNYTEFTAVISLQNTPRITLMIVMTFAVIYLAKQGIGILGRWSVIVLCILLLNILLTISLSLNIMNFSHIFPVMHHSARDITSNSFTVGTIAIGDLVALLTVTNHLKGSKSPYKVFLPGVLIGVLLFAIIILRNLFILGPSLDESAQFSTYTAARVIHIGNFVERVESTISFVYVLLGITKLAVYLSAVSIGVSKLLRVNRYKKLLVPVALCSLALGTSVFNNALEMFDAVWSYPYYAIVIQTGVPVLVWIGAEIKKRSRTKQEALGTQQGTPT